MLRRLLLRKEHFKSVFNIIIRGFTRNLQSQGGDNIPRLDDFESLSLLHLKIDMLNLKVDKLTNMIPAEFQTVLTRIDKFANDVAGLLGPIAARLDALAQAQLGNMTAEEEAAVKVELAGDADKLEAAAVALTALGSDPANPTPTPIPTPIQ